MSSVTLRAVVNDPEQDNPVPVAAEPAAQAPSAPVNGSARALLWLQRAKAAMPSPANLGKSLAMPLLGILIFIGLWALAAPKVDTSLGALPGPVEVAEQGKALWEEYQAVQVDKAEFYARQEEQNIELRKAGEPEQNFPYAGSPTFLDQILTSLKTVGMGFFLATFVAVPLGLICGLSKMFNSAFNPLVQIFKPVSPLAWLPIVTMVVSATMTNPDPMLAKSFVISAFTVMLCSLWPTLINTAVGVASIDKDLLNVGRVLRLGWFAKLTKLVLPSALPYIFTGMRLSLGVGWMVLIAAEMLAQNPGLGKFVWDEFQNGSSQSLARIMFAVVTIGLIGFLLDQMMAAIQSVVGRNAQR
jgi:nitrate/nitrite transport system permease protein